MRVRIIAVTSGVAMLLAMVTVRIVHLTLAQSPDLTRRARVQQRGRVDLIAHRGAILDRHGETLASSVECPSIYVRPRRLREGGAARHALAAALGLSPRAVASKLASESPFVWLKRAATPRERDAALALGLDGLGEVTEARRFYPHGTTAAHVLGSAGVDLQGLEGVELRYDRELRAPPRTMEIERDALGRAILSDGGADLRGLAGATVQLTIDAGLQTIAERALERAVRDARAAAGTAVVLDPWTGEVLALANVPTFDPNDHAAAPAAARRNRAVTDMYEPGSTFKAFLAAAALEYGVARPDELVFCEHGRLRVGGRTIRDHHGHGWLSLAEIIQVSSNIGAAKIGERLGRDRYHEHLASLGFGRPTGIDLPGETGGLLRPRASWTRIDLATASFGQGVAVTPIQMARAFAAIANGGLLVEPYVATRAVGAGGELVWERRPTVVRRVMRPETARAVTAMLERVVEEGGTGTRARIEGVRVAGKTGTAQKVEPGTGRYSPHGRIASFIGFLPADAPRLVILALVDEPRTSTYGGIVAAPVFRAIASEAIARLGVGLPQAPDWQQAAFPEAGLVRAAAAPTGVPSFLGLSMRAALARARELGWVVAEVNGTGYVTSQVPPPGAAAAPGKALVLNLTPADDVLS
jgi:cell division protein FtsI (penicillin-binding protein 3)